MVVPRFAVVYLVALAVIVLATAAVLAARIVDAYSDRDSSAETIPSVALMPGYRLHLDGLHERTRP